MTVTLNILWDDLLTVLNEWAPTESSQFHINNQLNQHIEINNFISAKKSFVVHDRYLPTLILMWFENSAQKYTASSENVLFSISVFSCGLTFIWIELLLLYGSSCVDVQCLKCQILNVAGLNNVWFYSCRKLWFFQCEITISNWS